MASSPTYAKKPNVPVFILAGGLGTRLSEETQLKPKPMVEIGEIPILVHLMRSYYAYGFNDFVICAGYRSWEIKQYFLNYEYRHRHLNIDHRENFDLKPRSLDSRNRLSDVGLEKWRVRVIDTGLESQTGARVARALDEVLATDTIEDFAVTYGDGLTDADLDHEFRFHKEHGLIGTVMGVRPTARFGDIQVEKDKRVTAFLEKHQSETDLINGGFFFFRKEFKNYLSADPKTILERAPILKLTEDRQLKLYEHFGFWHPMDTLREKTYLQSLWESGKAPWVRA